MRRYFARILRAFIVSSIGIGGGVALLVFIAMLVLKHKDAFQFSLCAGFSLGIVFALFLLAVFLPLDVAGKLFFSKMRYSDIWDIDRAQELEFKGTDKEAIILIRQALVALPHAKRVNQDTENSLVLATIGSSWRSFGEHMEIKITPIDDGSCRLCCRSEPLSSATIFDYGKNFDNVLTFLENFSQLAGAERIVQAS
jgi:hypothetical protein